MKRAAKRILIIDDSPLVLELARAALESAGYEVAIAETLESFEEHRKGARPDLILVDVQMPEVFGDDLAATLRGAYGMTLPILLLSSLSEDDLASRSEAANINGYVCKSAGVNVLLARVNEFLATNVEGSAHG